MKSSNFCFEKEKKERFFFLFEEGKEFVFFQDFFNISLNFFSESKEKKVLVF